MMVYSANNLPYSALSGVMTGDLAERTSLSSYRFVFAMSAQFVIQGLALPMVDYFGQGNSAKGYQITMGIFSALAVVFFVITFATTRERVQPDPTQKSSDPAGLRATCAQRAVDRDVRAHDRRCSSRSSMRGGVMLYYFKYYVQREDLFSLFNVLRARRDDRRRGALDAARASGIGKRDVFIVGLVAHGRVHRGVRLPAATAIAGDRSRRRSLRQFAYGFTIPLLWAMMADVADFSEWKNRRRATASCSRRSSSALKAGLGFGGAIGGWLLAAYGYVPNVAQTEHALQGSGSRRASSRPIDVRARRGVPGLLSASTSASRSR